MNIALSIVIPTIGRPELPRILGELLPQLSEMDEVLVVGDGPQLEARRYAEGVDPRIKYFEHGPDHCWGHPQRNWVMQKAVGSHLMSFDDDDRCAPTALRHVRQAIAENADQPLMFREHHEGTVIWKTRKLEIGNVSTQMFVTPNRPDRLGTWGRRYEGDFDFFVSTLALYTDKEKAVIWRPEIIAVHGTIGFKRTVDAWIWTEG